MNNETIKKRIRDLLNKTVENGCTEAEAMIAAKKVAELMAKYSLDRSTVDIMQRECVTGFTSRATRSFLWCYIEQVTNTLIICSGRRVAIYGMDPDPEVAAYLIDICNRAVDREVERFKQTDVYREKRTASLRRRATGDFTYALVMRIGKKIKDLFANNIDETISKHVEDTVAKSVDFDVGKPRQKTIECSDAYSAGVDAGDNVQINFGINGIETLALAKANEK